jgi:hypothetical protein
MRIAISGKIASGKTTISRYLEEKHGFKWAIIAGTIKELEVIHAGEQHWWEERIEPYCVSIAAASELNYGYVKRKILECFNRYPQMPGQKNRALLQDLGTETGRRYFGEDIWVNTVLEQTKDYENVVVDDCRYQNEFEALRKAGFATIRIEVPHNIQMVRVHELYGTMDDGKLNHPSELDLDARVRDFDYIIPGHVDVDILHILMDDILRKGSAA